MSNAAGSAVAYPHIELDSEGRALISGTTMKVLELVMAQQAHGWSPEELHFQFPHIGLAEVHSALAYYWDHRDEVEAEIARRRAYAEAARREAGPSPLAERLHHAQ